MCANMRILNQNVLPKFYQKMNVTLIFDHHKRATRENDGAVEVRVTDCRKVWYIATGVKVRKNEWKNGRVINRIDSDLMNERIEIVMRNITNAINEAIKNREKIGINELRDAVCCTIGEHEDPIKWMEETEVGISNAIDTHKHYITLFSKLRRFGKFCRWSDFTPSVIYDFDSFLSTERFPIRNSKTNEQLLSAASIYANHAKLRKMLGYAARKGKINRNPYDDVYLTRMKADKTAAIKYLREDEIEKVVSYRPNEKSQIEAHTLFVFQMFTGMAFADMMKFDKSMIVKDGDRYIYTAKRQKTGVPYHIMLLPTVVDLLDSVGWTLPRKSLVCYDCNLKVMAKRLGITEGLTAHMARHTFATIMLRYGVKLENLARMMGHTDISMTQRYAKVLAQSVNEEFERVSKIFDEKFAV